MGIVGVSCFIGSLGFCLICVLVCCFFVLILFLKGFWKFLRVGIFEIYGFFLIVEFLRFLYLKCNVIYYLVGNIRG